MADTRQFRRRLGRVRRQWKATAVLDGLVLVVTEAIGMFLVLVAADWVYSFSGRVRLGILFGALAVLGVLFIRHVLAPVFRRIPDEQIALFIEERSPEAEGTVVSALESQREERKGLAGFISGFLVDDAVRRIDKTRSRVFSSLARLKKHVVVAGVLILLSVATTMRAPTAARQLSERIVAPWISIQQERQEAEIRRQRELARELELYGPISFEIEPGNARLLRGSSTNIVVKLSRQPPDTPQLFYRFKDGGEWQSLPMEEIDVVNGFGRRFEDINQDCQYYVAAARQKSSVFSIDIFDPLALRGIELTYRYPAYLELDAQTNFAFSGDVSAIADTRIDIRIVANNQLQSGTLKFEGSRAIPLAPGPKPIDGAKASFVVTTNDSYTFELADIYGGKLASDQFYFIKAIRDEPPTIKMVSPKIDMEVHPLCELTFGAKVTDDLAIKEVVANATYYRGLNPAPMPLQLKPKTASGSFRNFKDGYVEYVLQLETITPTPKVGDMMFYYLTVSDRKGQTVKTDLYYMKLAPLEIVGVWPASASPPDLPHWDYNWKPDVILLAAAAWHLEQQRGKIPESEFKAQCKELAERMAPTVFGLNIQDVWDPATGKPILPAVPPAEGKQK